MIDAIFAHTMRLLVLDPLETHVTDRLIEAKAPVEIIVQMRDCLAAEVPALAARATGDPVWAGSLALQHWVWGSSTAEMVATAAPGCSKPMEAAAQHLTEG